jgi:hypothetical protein
VIDPALVTEQDAPQRWTCAHCSVEVRLMDSLERRGLPACWVTTERGPVCLGCRRELAADAAVSALDLSLKERAQLRSRTIVEFEVRRTPGRTNTDIANAAHSSVGAVQNARKRLAASGVPE